MRTLFATDGSAGSGAALAMLLALPHRPGDRIEVLSVPVHGYLGISFGEGGAFVAEVIEAEVALARRLAAEASGRLAARGVRTAARIAEGPAAEAILATAIALNSDLVVVGSRGRGRIAGTLLGSTARALARHSPIPVLVVRDRREAPRRILAAVDGSGDSYAAIASLAALPLPRQAEVTLVHVLPEVPSGSRPGGPREGGLRASLERRDRMAALEMLRAAMAALPSDVVARVEIERGPVPERVLAHAGAIGADLIVLGSRGASLGTGFLQGSTADRVLASARCAVLVARRTAAADAAAPPSRPAVLEQV